MKRRRYYSAALVATIALGALAYLLFKPARWAPGILATSKMAYTYQAGDELLGGATTVIDSSLDAYGRSPTNMVKAHWIDFYEGKAPFIREWDRLPNNAPSPLGPFFNAVGCDRCHEHDGRGQPPAPGKVSESMIVRFSVPGPDAHWLPEPAYGEQLDMYGADGKHGEGIVQVRYNESAGQFADGGSYSLMVPEYSFAHMSYGDLSSDVRFSPRVAPPNFGLGLLEAIPEKDILANADPDDRNHDGISGRPNIVADAQSGRPVLGRFGWKANQPTIEQQVEKAFNADLGITSTVYPENGPSGGLVRNVGASMPAAPELGAEDLRLVLFYVRLLAVPRQRDWLRPQVQHGRAIFTGIGCANCHVTHFETGDVPDFPELAHQSIHPYTDLLLHDMGENLADNRPDARATGNEWRTPPLWGIGLLRKVSGHTRFLHDGRARNIEEAVLWHGGESAASQELYRRLSKDDRAALLAFLESL